MPPVRSGDCKMVRSEVTNGHYLIKALDPFTFSVNRDPSKTQILTVLCNQFQKQGQSMLISLQIALELWSCIQMVE